MEFVIKRCRAIPFLFDTHRKGSCQQGKILDFSRRGLLQNSLGEAHIWVSNGWVHLPQQMLNSLKSRTVLFIFLSAPSPCQVPESQQMFLVLQWMPFQAKSPKLISSVRCERTEFAFLTKLHLVAFFPFSFGFLQDIRSCKTPRGC